MDDAPGNENQKVGNGDRFIASERITMHLDDLPYRREQACLFLPG